MTAVSPRASSLNSCCQAAVRRAPAPPPAPRAGAQEREARGRTLAHGVRRGGVATSRRPQRCGYPRSVCAPALLCVCALPGLAGIQWDKAMPFEGRAEGGWPLTVTGSFTAAATYKCQFAPLETSGVSFIASDPVAPSAGATRIVCTTPRWSLAAQRTRLSVLDAATSTPVASPGGTAEVITYVLCPAPICNRRLRVCAGRTPCWSADGDAMFVCASPANLEKQATNLILIFAARP
jgi:hypothetical protein